MVNSRNREFVTHLLRIKNTFIEGDVEGGGDDLTNTSECRKRASSQPAPLTGKLLEQTDPKPTSITLGDLPPLEGMEGKTFSEQSFSDDEEEEHADGYTPGKVLFKKPPSLEFALFQEGDNSKMVTQISPFSEPEKEQDPTGQAIQNNTGATAPSVTMQHGFIAIPCTWPVTQNTGSQADSEAAQRLALKAAQIADGSPSDSHAWDNIYTVMMRNLPNRVTQDSLLIAINEAGFSGSYDFVYLPIDPDTKTNRGYAFINLISPGHALMFGMHFEGWTFSNFKSQKVVSVVPAVVQGYDANYAHYSKARLKHLCESERPLFLRHSRQGRLPQGRRPKTSLIDKAVQLKQLVQENCDSLTDEGAGASNTAETRVPKFCPFCGGHLTVIYKFCEFCGQALPFAPQSN